MCGYKALNRGIWDKIQCLFSVPFFIAKNLWHTDTRTHTQTHGRTQAPYRARLPSLKMPQSGVGSMQRSRKGCLPLKGVFNCRSSSTTGCLPPKVVFHRRLSSTKGRLPPSGIMHHAGCNTLVDLIFLRTVNIPNLSLLPCLEVAYDAWCMIHDA